MCPLAVERIKSQIESTEEVATKAGRNDAERLPE